MNMGTNLSDTNKFIELYENLFDAMYFPKEEKTEESEIVIPKVSTKRSFFKKKEEIVIEEPEPKIRQEIYDAYMEIKNYLDNILSKPAQDFWTIWRFCQFIRWAEKVYLFDNDPKGFIFVDSGITDDIRCFLIRCGNHRIQFKLELREKPSHRIEEDKYNHIISINCKSDTGKQIETKMIIVDQDIDLADDSDLYLLNMINKELNTEIWMTCVDILDVLLEDVKKKDTLPRIKKGYYDPN